MTSVLGWLYGVNLLNPTALVCVWEWLNGKVCGSRNPRHQGQNVWVDATQTQVAVCLEYFFSILVEPLIAKNELLASYLLIPQDGHVYCDSQNDVYWLRNK